MTRGVPGPGEGEPSQAGQTRLKATGKFGKGHTAENWTGKVEDHSDLVPKQNFRNPGVTFTFTVAKEMGAKYVFWFILSSIFPFIAPPHISLLDPKTEKNLEELEAPKILEGLKQFPIQDDPVVLFNLYTQLDKQIEELRSLDTSKKPTLAEVQQEHIAALEKVQGEVKGEIASRLSELRTNIGKSALTLLQTLAKREDISLPKGPFAVQAQAFTEQLERKQGEALEARNALAEVERELKHEERA